MNRIVERLIQLEDGIKKFGQIISNIIVISGNILLRIVIVPFIPIILLYDNREN